MTCAALLIQTHAKYLSSVRRAVQGRDDMRMDERLMQVLRAANGALAIAPSAAVRRLAVTPFAIAPLGPRLGLVQWVLDTLPLFQVGQAVRRRLRGTAFHGNTAFHVVFWCAQ